MSDLLKAKANDIYRSKGVLAFSDQGDTKFVFQGVHEQINFGPSEKPWRPDEVRQGDLPRANNLSGSRVGSETPVVYLFAHSCSFTNNLIIPLPDTLIAALKADRCVHCNCYCVYNSVGNYTRFHMSMLE